MDNFEVFVNWGKLGITSSTFPGGETYIKLDDTNRLFPVKEGSPDEALIHMKFRQASDITTLMFIVDALRRKGYHKLEISLVMPYLPYARQDRVCNVGESFSLKVVSDIINSLNFTTVVCHDIHSDVGIALINNLKHVKQSDLSYALESICQRENTVLVSPDAGSNKKVFEFAKQYQYPEVVRADKIRDTLTGEIKETVVYSEHIGAKNFLILDDICDGGRTFTELAKKLRPLTDGAIFLYVTHAILSKGLEPLISGGIDHIFTTNMMSDYVRQNESDLMTIYLTEI